MSEYDFQGCPECGHTEFTLRKDGPKMFAVCPQCGYEECVNDLHVSGLPHSEVVKEIMASEGDVDEVTERFLVWYGEDFQGAFTSEEGIDAHFKSCMEEDGELYPNAIEVFRAVPVAYTYSPESTSEDREQPGEDMELLRRMEAQHDWMHEPDEGDLYEDAKHDFIPCPACHGDCAPWCDDGEECDGLGEYIERQRIKTE